MMSAAAALLAGMLIASMAPGLPPTGCLYAALGVGLLCAAHRRLRLPSFAVVGAAWFSLHAGWALSDRLPADADRSEVRTEFVVEDFPRRRGRAVTFIARTTVPSLPDRVRLNWYEAGVMPRIGERWELGVVLRSPRGLVNPGGFDYERWLFTNGIGATGYVRGQGRRLATPGPADLAWWRQRMARGIEAALPPDRGRAVMIALATGSRHAMDAASGELFRITGTSHLMAISGLHVGLVAGLVFLVSGRLAGAVTGVSAGRDVAAALALLAAFGYGLLAGFGTPVRRALLMLATLTLAGRWRRPAEPWSGLSLALIVVLVVQPLDCLTPGFALSFGAVAAILAILGADRAAAHGRQSPLRRLVSLQVRLSFLLMPLTLIQFDRIAWAAVPANLLAIPVFGFFVVPVTLLGGLLGLVLETPARWLLRIAHGGLAVLLDILGGLAALPGAAFDPPGRGAMVASLLALAALTVLLPRMLPGRWLPAWLALGLVLWRPATLPPGCVRADVLDVGQGLSVLLRTRRHALLYDAGPAYGSGSDAGERVVVPSLRALGVRRVDAMLISHADADHAGGAASVMRGVPVDRVLSGEAGELAALGARACRRGMGWVWDGVHFAVVWPDGAGGKGNDASCVLTVRTGQAGMLLPGDIEIGSERRLLETGALGPMDVVVMPHHGSATSSSESFTATLRPDLAIAAAGWRNRWGFPRSAVVERWRASGARVLSTGQAGAIALTLCEDGEAPRVIALRAARRRIWSAGPAASASGVHPF
ncbi:MAG: DNA internalization-related competence protein ComEC/Rec2 [Gammaproteobacteria bacterium]